MIAIDVIGDLLDPPVLGEDGETVLTPGARLPGWHINATESILEWEKWRVTPATPRRVFSGVQTWFYTFSNAAEFETAQGQGMTAQPAQPVVPASVDDLQLRLALNELGLRDAVETAVVAGGQELQDWWLHSKRIERTHPLVLGVAAQLGVDSAGTDALFILAATL